MGRMKIYLRKLGATTLGVQDDAGAEFLAGLKMGEVVSCEATKPRNYRFLRKYFALLNLAFDYWEPPEGQYKGQAIEKEFERFRKDVQIMAGYGRPVWNINGDLRMESLSISFGKMKQETFDKLYNAVLTVLMRKVLQAKGFDEATVNSLVDQLADFA